MEGEAVDLSLVHREDFFAIMEVKPHPLSPLSLSLTPLPLLSWPQAFGHSFLQKDIALFKQNLSALETLNKKHKLYSKVGYLCSLIPPIFLINLVLFFTLTNVL